MTQSQKYYNLLLLVGLTILLSSCWEKQNHAILRPEIPHYQLTGSVVDIDTGGGLPGVSLTLQSVQMIYDVPQMDTTLQVDSTGFFSVDTIYPGSYLLNIYRAGYPVIDKPLVVEHEDKEVLIEAPTPWIATGHAFLGTINPGSSNPRFTFQGTKFWMMGTYTGYMYRNYYTNVSAILPLILSGSVLNYDRAFLNQSPSAAGLTFGNNIIYAYYSRKVDLILPTTGQINSTVMLDAPISGLTCNNGEFYSTWGQTIQVRGASLNSIQDTLHTDTGSLAMLTKYGDTFMAYDQDRQVVVKLDNQGDVMHTFRLFSDLDGHPIVIYAMNYEATGNLWTSQQYHSHIYRFGE